MAWSKINGHMYYYRSKYVDGAIQTRYCGKGEAGQAAAVFDRLESQQRELQKRQDVDYLDLISKELKELHRDASWIETLLRMDAISLGFERYRAGSEWRMRSKHV